MDRKFAVIEIEIFFQSSSELRAHGREAKPSVRKVRDCLNEIAPIAMHTEHSELAVRCRAILEEFSPRFDHARVLLSEVDAHAAVYR
jgi:hypothetical protein